MQTNYLKNEDGKNTSIHFQPSRNMTFKNAALSITSSSSNLHLKPSSTTQSKDQVTAASVSSKTDSKQVDINKSSTPQLRRQSKREGLPPLA